MSAALIDAARELHAHGVNVIPVRDDGSKAPALRAWQTHTTTEGDLVQWFGGDDPRYRALGAVCGAPSGGLELLEIEGPHVGELEAVGRAAGAAGLLALWEQVNGGWCEKSPSGGVHWLYRVQGMDVPGNTKLAADADRATIAETRGTGGQVVLAPTGGTAHRTGKPWTRLDGGPATVPTLSAEERDALHGLFRTLDRTPQRQPAPVPATLPQRAEGPRPGDLWAARTTWAELLGPHGWQVHHTGGVETHWTRPGKSTTEGPSATTREDGGLYVFSTSTAFDAETPYSKFGAYAVLEHGGDHSAAARALAAEGFTDRPIGPAAPTVCETVTEAPEALTEAEPPSRPSWSPVDLSAYLNGTATAVEPTLMARTDGVKLLYPGHVHSVAGESESGKSMLMLAVAAQVLTDGGRVLFMDYESDPATVLDRLVKLGAPVDAVAERLDYVQPEADPENGGWADVSAFLALLGRRYALAVLDGVTEALSVSGVPSIDNDEVTGWIRRLPRRIARTTGAAVVMVDHVTKSTEGRGRFAIGAQAKLSALDGASFLVEPLAPLGVGMAGKLAVRIGKDRPGRVRPHGGAWRKSDRTQAVAVALIDSTDPRRIAFTLEAPAREVDPEVHAVQVDDGRRRAIVEWIADRPQPPTFNQIAEAVAARRPAVREALDALIADGTVIATPGARNSTLHQLAPIPAA
ncbi:bifunctional DNA primase/polymerase [Micrococcus sp. 2A]|uniref:bifunctional DNA primase/polymerase n=1 Tax=Micrococcus sp. 2A TaxID=3142261 RepID=UPI0026190024|nr:bifunctional DNA primase/polymerase [uncultured Micrococcus sp.]